MAIAPLKVSYCTTCKGRLHHLRDTLPANMAAERDNPNVEFVVLDYGSEDGLGDWIREKYSNEIATGRLRYARYEAADFQMAHAKNMAHRLATGDIVCNLDADNYIVPDFSRWLNAQYAKHPDSFITNLPARNSDPWMRRIKRAVGMLELHPPGASGRIAMKREHFHQLGGYDESYSAHGYDDWDISVRAKDAGLRITSPGRERFGAVIEHSDEERMQNLSQEDRRISEGYFAKHERLRNQPHPQRILNALSDHLKLVHAGKPVRANPDGTVGCGEVTVNFADTPTCIEPMTAARSREASPSTEPQVAPRTDWAEKLTARTHPQITPRAR